MPDLEMNGNLIQFKGELNEELVKDLKDLILAKQDFPEEVILDLTELEGIGVMGIQIILAVRENLMKHKSGFRTGLVIPVQFGCIPSVFLTFQMYFNLQNQFLFVPHNTDSSLV